MKPGEKLEDKPRLLKEIAEYYQVHPSTVSRWLKCDTLKHIRKNGYYYTINQLKEIVAHLG